MVPSATSDAPKLRQDHDRRDRVAEARGPTKEWHTSPHISLFFLGAAIPKPKEVAPPESGTSAGPAQALGGDEVSRSESLKSSTWSIGLASR